MKKVLHNLLGILVITVIISGCASMNKSQKGAVIGTTGGAAVGGAIGSMSGHVGIGALIGAAVGGVGGAIIGHKMDKQAADIQKDLPNAKVERVGEGIIVEFSDKILFSVNSADLSYDSKLNLNKLNNILIKYPDTDIEIQGHTDNTGSSAYNQTLSEKRASSVSAYLTSNGISSSRLTTKGYGEEAPKYSNETVDGRLQNRNVQFLISANSVMKEAAKKETGTGN